MMVGLDYSVPMEMERSEFEIDFGGRIDRIW